MLLFKVSFMECAGKRCLPKDSEILEVYQTDVITPHHREWEGMKGMHGHTANMVDARPTYHVADTVGVPTVHMYCTVCVFDCLYTANVHIQCCFVRMLYCINYYVQNHFFHGGGLCVQFSIYKICLASISSNKPI